MTKKKTARKERTVGRSSITFTIDVQDIVDALDNPQMAPMMAAIHQAYGEHIESLAKQGSKKKVRKKA